MSNRAAVDTFTMVGLTEAQAAAFTPSTITVEPDEDLDTHRSTPTARVKHLEIGVGIS